MATLRQALQYAAQNPTSDFAKFLTVRIQSGQADDEARQSGIDLTAIKNITASVPTTPKEPGYFSRVGQQYAESGQNVISGIQEGAQQIQKGGFFNTIGGALRGGLRTVGEVARGAFAPITEAPVVKPALEKVGEAITKIPGAEEIIKQLTDLAEKHPQAAKDIQNIIDVTVLTGLPAIEKPAGAIAGEIATKTGRVLEESGLAAQKTAREALAKELVMPIETKAVRIAQVGRTSEAGTGIFKKSEIRPTILEQRAIDEIAKIPEISARQTYQQKYNIIKGVNTQKAQQLVADIEANDFILPKRELISRLNNTAANLGDNPVIVGDAEKTALRLVEGAKKIINENEGTGSGILKARKEYDAWVQSQKPKAFDAKTENAFSIANREIRQTFNNLLEEKAPTLGIKQSLQEQSSLFYALKNIEPKAAEEADTAILRALQKAGKILGTKNRIVQAVAAAAGIGGLGAAATFAPAAAVLGGAGFVIFKGGQLILKPEVRILLGKLLQESGKLLNPADRKIIEDALNTYRETPKEAGFINFGEDISKKAPGAIPKTTIPKELESLAQETRKYKSAEEFVKANLKIDITDFPNKSEWLSYNADVIGKGKPSREVYQIISKAEDVWDKKFGIGNFGQSVIKDIPVKSILQNEYGKTLDEVNAILGGEVKKRSEFFAGKEIPPIEVLVDNSGKIHIVDGRNRLIRAYQEGRETIPSKINGYYNLQKSQLTDFYNQVMGK